MNWIDIFHQMRIQVRLLFHFSLSLSVCILISSRFFVSFSLRWLVAVNSVNVKIYWTQIDWQCFNWIIINYCYWILFQSLFFVVSLRLLLLFLHWLCCCCNNTLMMNYWNVNRASNKSCGLFKNGETHRKIVKHMRNVCLCLLMWHKVHA